MRIPNRLLGIIYAYAMQRGWWMFPAGSWIELTPLPWMVRAYWYPDVEWLLPAHLSPGRTTSACSAYSGGITD